MTDFRLFQTKKEFADDNFKFDENSGQFSYRVETLWEKKKLFPKVYSKDLHGSHVKNRGKGPRVNGIGGQICDILIFDTLQEFHEGLC